MMKIIEEGMYMSITVKKFMLMQEIEDALNIPAMVESLMFVKVCTIAIQKICETKLYITPLLLIDEVGHS